MCRMIYVSGPITDNKTGLPRDGWQQDFKDAELMLRGMGFEVLTPIEIASEVENSWRVFHCTVQGIPDLEDLPAIPRWVYVKACLDRLEDILPVPMFVDSVCDDKPAWNGSLCGVYVIGAPDAVRESYGTMCEINFALSASVPVFSKYYGGALVDNAFIPEPSGLTIEEYKKQIAK